jgi:transcription-repair coupling factor (superfamily II helicase)
LGRVGRSSHRAYAYLVCPDEVSITNEARKRMEVIRELTELGSGFRVAAYDLEIRGAGELLGSAQSGHITLVGFDMYTQLLEEAVGEMKGEPRAEEPEPEINIKVSQYIPEDYVPDTRQRLNFYKRLASVGTDEELEKMEEEMADRYGDVPPLVGNLFEVVRLKLLLKGLKARELSQKGARLYLAFDGDGTGKLAAHLLSMIEKAPRRFRLTPDSRFVYSMEPGTSPLAEARYLLQEVVKGC